MNGWCVCFRTYPMLPDIIKPYDFISLIIEKLCSLWWLHYISLWWDYFPFKSQSKSKPPFLVCLHSTSKFCVINIVEDLKYKMNNAYSPTKSIDTTKNFLCCSNILEIMNSIHQILSQLNPGQILHNYYKFS